MNPLIGVEYIMCSTYARSAAAEWTGPAKAGDVREPAEAGDATVSTLVTATSTLRVYLIVLLGCRARVGRAEVNRQRAV
jgi:hypothetical protein